MKRWRATESAPDREDEIALADVSSAAFNWSGSSEHVFSDAEATNECLPG